MLNSNFPISKRLVEVLKNRELQGILRKLSITEGLIDFYSNDYLGFSRSEELEAFFLANYNSFKDSNGRKLGSTGSRLLSGNSLLAEEIEHRIALFHKAEAALLFNSGYDANLGCISAFVREGDTIIYDELIHASMHDGIKLTKAFRVPFQHNDTSHLETLLQNTVGQVFILVETIYSMDGDMAPLAEICRLGKKYNANIIGDEAHATGLFGQNGRGVTCHLNLENELFARIVTFSKALGVHGAVVLTTQLAKQYLINFARSFIYATAPSFPSLLEIKSAYELLEHKPNLQADAMEIISYFKSKAQGYPNLNFIKESNSMIQALVIPGSANARHISQKAKEAGHDVRPLVYPTVAKGKERIRICLHTFNKLEDIDGLLYMLNKEQNN